MSGSGLVMYEEDLRLIQAVCNRLYSEANARAVLLIDKNGQPIAEAGETATLDVTSLASLTAGNVAATGGIAKLLQEGEFAGLYHEGKNIHVMIHLVAERLILIVLFDGRSSQGLVKLRIRKAQDELHRAFDSVMRKAQHQPAAFSEITEADIDKLFGD